MDAGSLPEDVSQLSATGTGGDGNLSGDSGSHYWGVYKRGDKEYVFYLSSWFKKYRLTFFDFSSLKNKRLIDDLLIYFEQEREGFTNWKWLVLDYYSVGRTNQPFKMFDRPI